jgi:hypothetical protein
MTRQRDLFWALTAAQACCSGSINAGGTGVEAENTAEVPKALHSHDQRGNHFEPPLYNITAGTIYEAGRQHGQLAGERIRVCILKVASALLATNPPTKRLSFAQKTPIRWTLVHRQKICSGCVGDAQTTHPPPTRLISFDPHAPVVHLGVHFDMI